MGGAVFVSYAREDTVAVLRICGALRVTGIKVWFAQSELIGGETPPALCAWVKQLLSGSGMEAGRVRPVERGEGAASPT